MSLYAAMAGKVTSYWYEQGVSVARTALKSASGQQRTLERSSRMSGFGGKADVVGHPSECPLVAISRHLKSLSEEPESVRDHLFGPRMNQFKSASVSCGSAAEFRGMQKLVGSNTRHRFARAHRPASLAGTVGVAQRQWRPPRSRHGQSSNFGNSRAIVSAASGPPWARPRQPSASRRTAI